MHYLWDPLSRSEVHTSPDDRKFLKLSLPDIYQDEIFVIENLGLKMFIITPLWSLSIVLQKQVGFGKYSLAVSSHGWSVNYP